MSAIYLKNASHLIYVKHHFEVKTLGKSMDNLFPVLTDFHDDLGQAT